MESRFSHGSSRSSSNWYNFRRGPGRIMTNTSNVNHEWSFAHPMNNFLNISKSSINNEFSPQSCHCPIPYVLAPQKKNHESSGSGRSRNDINSWAVSKKNGDPKDVLFSSKRQNVYALSSEISLKSFLKFPEILWKESLKLKPWDEW